MDPIDLLFISLVALVAGTVGQLTSKYSRGGWPVNLGVAFAGAVLGVYVSRTYGFNEIYTITYRKVEFPVIWALIGAVLSVAGISLLVRPGRR